MFQIPVTKNSDIDFQLKTKWPASVENCQNLHDNRKKPDFSA
jgi:hypothetical protein